MGLQYCLCTAMQQLCDPLRFPKSSGHRITLDLYHIEVLMRSVREEVFMVFGVRVIVGGHSL